MKRIGTIAVLLLVFAHAVLLFSCGANGGAEGGGESTPSTSLSSAEAQCEEDRRTLEEKGYFVTVRTESLKDAAAGIDVDSSLLDRILSAEKDGKRILAFYFRIREQAAVCFEGGKEGFKLAGYCLVSGDDDNLFG